MQLKEGPMNFRELSVWFGLKPDTITKGSKSAKEKKLQRLKNFCDYHLEDRKIIIDRVIIPEYAKSYDVIDEYFDDEWGYIVNPETHKMSWQYKARVDTCTRVARAIQRKHPEARQVSEKTASAYACHVRTKGYGPTYKDVKGEKGYCEIVYLNEDETGLLSDEQMKIMHECRQEAYREVDEMRFKLDEAYHMKEITKEEWQKEIGEIDTKEAYCDMQELLYEKLGFIPQKRTRLFDDAF